MIFLYAFLIGGAICALGQIIQDRFKLAPGHITVLFVSLGAFLEFFDIYDHLIRLAGAGALLPITSFGHTVAEGAYHGAMERGILGLLEGILKPVSVGISVAIILSVLSAIIFRPKD